MRFRENSSWENFKGSCISSTCSPHVRNNIILCFWSCSEPEYLQMWQRIIICHIIWAQIGSNWHQMGQKWDYFRSDFSTFWLDDKHSPTLNVSYAGISDWGTKWIIFAQSGINPWIFWYLILHHSCNGCLHCIIIVIIIIVIMIVSTYYIVHIFLLGVCWSL